jgi:hypothetical protein
MTRRPRASRRPTRTPMCTPAPVEYLPYDRTREPAKNETLRHGHAVVALLQNERLLENFEAFIVFRSSQPRGFGSGRYLDFYNGRRPHSSLDDRTPDQAYFDLPPLRAAA